MTYLEQLETAKKNNIDCAKLYIAEEVAVIFGREHERFEDVCEAVYNLWLGTDLISINTLVNSVKELLDKEEITIDGVFHHKQDWDDVIEYACYYGC